MLADELDHVVGGNTHRDRHILAVAILPTGAVVAQRSVPATMHEYAAEFLLKRAVARFVVFTRVRAAGDTARRGASRRRPRVRLRPTAVHRCCGDRQPASGEWQGLADEAIAEPLVVSGPVRSACVFACACLTAGVFVDGLAPGVGARPRVADGRSPSAPTAASWSGEGRRFWSRFRTRRRSQEERRRRPGPVEAVSAGVNLLRVGPAWTGWTRRELGT